MAARAIFIRLLAAGAIFLIEPSLGLCQLTPTAPSYSAQSIVQAATQTAGALAPNTIATIYGSNLSYSTATATSSSLVSGSLPESLAGVSVVVNGWEANIFYVSPTQINFLVPYQLTPGTVTVIVVCDGLSGPEAQIQLNSTAPGMFVYNGMVLATHLNGTLLTAASPATPGEIIIIYALGLGKVSPATTSGKIVTSAATITAASQMQILLGGTPCPAADILYAGLAPGFAGLYQINMIVPPLTPPNPNIQISFGSQISPPGIPLAAQ
jgi:uncharacterized protein (TIGR03437 family)